MDPRVARRWLVSGRVQGVGFRYFAQRKARALGLAGWARNLDDGRVEVYAIGNRQDLETLGASLYVGPSHSEVRAVEEREETIQNRSGFNIL